MLMGSFGEFLFLTGGLSRYGGVIRFLWEHGNVWTASERNVQLIRKNGDDSPERLDTAQEIVREARWLAW